nr:beta-ketoacyl synthase N-terminal-like domain-containing protein [Kibdelosporangium sp. MJ126-NF4]CEL19978.1 Polyketide chain length factor WhiE-CLF [Kibdelosporangium sp. MJ126-NF4]CTQ97202.1 Polyketide chain length factor WhiE-CLF [Kibdelosporangium sp. MJ126-NF4]
MNAPLVTGIGVIAPTGIGVSGHWQSSLDGVRRLRPLGRPDAGNAPIKVAGEVDEFVESEHVPSKVRVQTDRWTWFALAASQMALDDARLSVDEHDPFDLSVVTASASGGNEFGQREIQALWKQHPKKVSAYQSIGWFYAASTGQISIRHQLKGGCGVVVSDSAGALDALNQARRVLRSGGKAVLVGGTEAPLSPYALSCQSSLRQLNPDPSPETAYRPFHPSGVGYVPGEGGAIMILEDAASAAARGVDGYAAFLGHAATHDAFHPSKPSPEGRQLARAISNALERAGVGPDDVDVVFADGAGDAEADAGEANALRAVFGGRLADLPVTIPKTMVGRLMSGAGALDVAWAALALHTGELPPTVNADAELTRQHYGINLVTERTRPQRLRTALVIARGVGGFNSAVVLGAVDGRRESL